MSVITLKLLCYLLDEKLSEVATSCRCLNHTDTEQMYSKHLSV